MASVAWLSLDQQSIPRVTHALTHMEVGTESLQSPPIYFFISFRGNGE